MRKYLLTVLWLISLSCAKGGGPNILSPDSAIFSYESQSTIVYSSYDYYIVQVKIDDVKYDGTYDIGTLSSCSAHSFDADWIHWDYSIDNGFAVITVDENQSENIRKGALFVSAYVYNGSIVITQYPKSK